MRYDQSVATRIVHQIYISTGILVKHVHDTYGITLFIGGDHTLLISDNTSLLRKGSRVDKIFSNDRINDCVEEISNIIEKEVFNNAIRRRLLGIVKVLIISLPIIILLIHVM
jgi:hypothetical protein